ncbi:hypothetical protein OSB04_009897 [Centaurea solstitialis]|uniref:Mitochondrial carrier protein n=1 Tax=Centaurea solstitialis TaxID=347529 RepID=A0AA38T6H4_9ASTR|nr:hypothetical protein OSB04_009897 [Centaurea solstitialis]
MLEKQLSNNTRSDGPAIKTGLAETRESLSREYAKNMMKTSTGLCLCAQIIFLILYRIGLIVPTSNLQAESTMKPLSSGNGEEDELSEIKEGQERKFVKEERSPMHIFSLTPYKLHMDSQSKTCFCRSICWYICQLCLHPVDTIKTSFSLAVLIKDHSVYRFIRTLPWICKQYCFFAPISAIYTFSYESVKGALLPLFTKEYQSLAHCVAGGCASVATSFVFTPSERIKQQMQVGSHYTAVGNISNALLGIVGKGGFSSLYNGWGAVLCRNVPHSIIKFYTYESLKNIMLSSHEAHAQPTTYQWFLLCGGVAASSAALFTTPFDVVKTRLQTQVPGSVNRYHGVFNTLKDISQHEGLKGLYRGLSPRLAMYMTQGALFFASYESFKRLFSTELEPSLKDYYTLLKSKSQLQLWTQQCRGHLSLLHPFLAGFPISDRLLLFPTHLLART